MAGAHHCTAPNASRHELSPQRELSLGAAQEEQKLLRPTGGEEPFSLSKRTTFNIEYTGKVIVVKSSPTWEVDETGLVVRTSGVGSEKTLYVKMDSKGAHTSTMKLKQHTIEIVPDAPPTLFRLFSQGKSLAEVIEIHGELLKGRAFAGRDVDAPPYATVGTLTKITTLDGQFGGVDAATGALGGLHAAYFSCAQYRSGFESVGQYKAAATGDLMYLHNEFTATSPSAPRAALTAATLTVPSPPPPSPTRVPCPTPASPPRSAGPRRQQGRRRQRQGRRLRGARQERRAGSELHAEPQVLPGPGPGQPLRAASRREDAALQRQVQQGRQLVGERARPLRGPRAAGQLSGPHLPVRELVHRAPYAHAQPDTSPSALSFLWLQDDRLSTSNILCRVIDTLAHVGHQ